MLPSHPGIPQRFIFFSLVFLFPLYLVSGAQKEVILLPQAFSWTTNRAMCVQIRRNSIDFRMIPKPDALSRTWTQFNNEFVMYSVLVSSVLVTCLSGYRKTRSSMLGVIHFLVLLANEEKTQHESWPHSSPIPETSETGRRPSNFSHTHPLTLQTSKTAKRCRLS